MGFYSDSARRVPITAMRVAADAPADDRSSLEVMRTDTTTFAALIEARRNRRDAWYVRPAGYIDVCSVPIPVREAAPGPR